MDKNLRQAYLKEHVENCSQLTGNIMGDMERYRLVYREDTAYMHKFIGPMAACRHFYEFLKEELDTDRLPDPEVWEKARDNQQTLYDTIAGLVPQTWRNDIPPTDLETIHWYDSDELKLAKYHTNLLRICRTLLHLMQWAEAPAQRISKGELRWMDVFTPSDTVTLGDTVKGLCSPAFFDDPRKYTGIAFKDMAPVCIQLGTGHFRFRARGPNPTAYITYFNQKSLKNESYEVAF